ncbi:hypothetical protein QZH41_019986 [Actinostola sp. cb2023]|nr:hypothetical protein QZH41_019986 [Actinostola sp. cb2023]
MVCHYTLPRANTMARYVPSVRKTAWRFLIVVKHRSTSHVNFPNCSNYKPSADYDMMSNDSCVRTGMFEFKQPEKSKDIILPIVLPIFFVVILIIFVVVAFIVVRHKREQKERAMNNSRLMLSDGALTMREKLRADSLKSLDSRMLRLYDPSKIKHYGLDNVEYLKDLGEGHFGKVFQDNVEYLKDLGEGHFGKVFQDNVEYLKDLGEGHFGKVFQDNVEYLKDLGEGHFGKVFQDNVEYLKDLGEGHFGKVFQDNVDYLKDLGEGHFGKVFQGRAVGILDGQPKKEVLVAVKALKEGSSKQLKEEFYQEVALMSIFSHPNIVSLIAVSTEEEPYGMIFEFMPEGDLNHYLRTANPAVGSLEVGSKDAKVILSHDDLIRMSEQIAAGMEEVAKLKFIHRDLAARNCLVGPNLVVKIADFGMSRDIYQSDYYKVELSVVIQGIHLGKPDLCPDVIYNLMKDCWAKEPSDRPGFDLIQKRLRDPYGDYDVPRATSVPDSLDGEKDSGSQNLGKYDIPKSPGKNTYDIPKSAPGDVDLSQNYDIPKSPVHGEPDEQENLDEVKELQGRKQTRAPLYRAQNSVEV